jgi:cell division protein FtsB
MEKTDSRFLRIRRRIEFWTRRRRTIFAAVLLLCIIGVVFGEYGLISIFQLRRDGHRLEAAIMEAKVQERILEERKAKLESDPFTLEWIARENYGFYRKGEKIFIFQDGDTNQTNNRITLDNYSLNQ